MVNRKQKQRFTMGTQCCLSAHSLIHCNCSCARQSTCRMTQTSDEALSCSHLFVANLHISCFASEVLQCMETCIQGAVKRTKTYVTKTSRHKNTCAAAKEVGHRQAIFLYYMRGLAALLMVATLLGTLSTRHCCGAV